MSSSKARDAILARRAMFVATALSGLGLAGVRRAGAEEGPGEGGHGTGGAKAASSTPEIPADAPASSVSPVSPVPSASSMVCLSIVEPPIGPPHVCLSPPFDHHEPSRLRRGVHPGVEASFDVMAQTTGSSRPLAFGPTMSLFLNVVVERGIDLRASVTATVARSTAGLVAPIGARLGLAFSYFCEYRSCFVTTLDAEVGRLFVGREPGPAGDLQPRPGSWVQPSLSPIGYRFGEKLQLELGLRIGIGLAPLGDAESNGFGVAFVTTGLWFSWLALPDRWDHAEARATPWSY